ncbi:MAG: hypothetical protein WAV25_01085 [Minisyncoccia bacterium]
MGMEGYVVMLGPLSEEVFKMSPWSIKEVREFMRGVHDLNLRIWHGPRLNEEPLGVVMAKIEGFFDESISIEEMGGSIAGYLAEIELHYRGPVGGIC